MNLFQPGLPIFKGNLHTHTTISDGRLTPQETLALYQSHGYDFLALTDHWRVNEAAVYQDMLVLPGVELDVWLTGQVVHVVGIGVTAQLTTRVSRGDGPQQLIDGIREDGGRAILCHPAWSMNTVEVITSLQGLTACEVYNSFSDIPWNNARGDAGAVLDLALAQGLRTRLVASDDTHRYTGDACKSFIRVQAQSLTQAALLEGIDRGAYYASQGPAFDQITVEDGLITVACSPVDHIAFYSNLVCGGRNPERCTAGQNVTGAQYRISEREGETVVRCELRDRFGRRAWSSPIYVEEPGRYSL